MVAYFLLLASLVIIPVVTEIGLHPVLPDTIVNILTVKSFLALVFALSISWAVISKRGIQPQWNQWPAILLTYVCLHSFFARPIEFEDPAYTLINAQSKYLPLFYCLIYYLFFLSAQWVCQPLKHKETVAKSLMWVGYVSAIYLILQSLGLDDRFELNNAPNTPYTEGARLFSFFGHPNFAGTFIALTIPFSFLFRKYLFSAVMVIAVFLSQSLFSALGLIAGLLFYLWGRLGNVGRMVLALIAIAVTNLLFFSFSTGLMKFPSNGGRFVVWKNMLEDIVKAPLFGYGFGSFAMVFNSLHPNSNPFQSAHNEILQFAWMCGIAGGILLVSAIISLVKKSFVEAQKNEIVLAFLSSFVIILVCSQGQFVWQVEPARYISVLIISILTVSIHKGGVR